MSLTIGKLSVSSLSPQTNSPNQNDVLAAVEPSFVTKLFASALFSGYSPVASGTVGSAVGAAIYFIPGFESLACIGPFILIVFIFGIKAATIMEQRYGHDPSEVTIDEVVGMWISLFFLPKNIFIVLTAFFLFRFLDIVKPYPAHKFDVMHGGFGIMMDDVIAGMYANIIIQLVIRISLFKDLLLR